MLCPDVVLRSEAGSPSERRAATPSLPRKLGGTNGTAPRKATRQLVSLSARFYSAMGSPRQATSSIMPTPMSQRTTRCSLKIF